MRLLSLFFLCMSLTVCSSPQSNVLKVGTIAGPETELVDVAKGVAEQKYGCKIKIVEFNDYNLPNEALEDGSLDINVYQHLPYLQAAIQAHGYHLQPVAKTFIYPMGIYSKKFKTLMEVKPKAVIAIPNDPSNEARALALLQQAGLIRLKSTTLPSIKEIEENPKQLIFKELDAAQLPRILMDVDMAVINSTFAVPAGLNPTVDAIYIENKDSPYANLIVIRQGDNNPQIAQFIQAFHSPAVKEKAQSLFGKAAIPAW